MVVNTYMHILIVIIRSMHNMYIDMFTSCGDVELAIREKRSFLIHRTGTFLWPKTTFKNWFLDGMDKNVIECLFAIRSRSKTLIE